MPIRIMNKGELPGKTVSANLFGLPDADPSVEALPEGLSFCLIMKNEEKFLERCLASVAGVADELCIVDTGSTDRSIEIAQSFGARIQTIEWPKDFAKARNVSLAMAQYRWILTLDADEEVTPQSLFALQQIRKAPAALTAVMCRINNKTRDSDGAQSTFSHYLPRMFPNTPKLRYMGAVHERLVVEGDHGVPMVDSPIVLLHYGYQAEILEERDKTARNLPLIMKEAEENPNDTFCIFNLAMMQMSLGKTDECIENFEKMFRLAEEKNEKKNRAYFAPAHISLAMEYYRSRGDYDKAMGLIDACLEINEYYPNALYFKSNLHAIKGEHEAARACLIKAVDAQEYIKAYAFVDEEICLWKAKYYLGLSYAGTRDYDKALEWLDRTVEARPGFMEIRQARARVLEAMNKSVEAEAAFREIADEFRNDVSLLEYISFLNRRKRYTKIIDICMQELEGRSDGAQMQLYIHAADAAHNLGRPEAQEYLDKARAIESRPHVGVVLQALDELYQKLGREEERQELRAWELEQMPECRTVHDFARRCSRLLEEGRYEEVVKFADRGLQLAPEQAHLLMNSGIAQQRLGEDEQAITRLAKVDPYIDLDMYVTATYLRALLLQKQGKLDAALDALDGLLKWQPKQVDALLMRARLLVDTQRFTDAEAVLIATMELDAARGAVDLAGLYMRLGRYADAQNIAERILGGVPAVA